MSRFQELKEKTDNWTTDEEDIVIVIFNYSF